MASRISGPGGKPPIQPTDSQPAREPAKQQQEGKAVSFERAGRSSFQQLLDTSLGTPGRPVGFDGIPDEATRAGEPANEVPPIAGEAVTLNGLEGEAVKLGDIKGESVRLGDIKGESVKLGDIKGEST